MKKAWRVPGPRCRISGVWTGRAKVPEVADLIFVLVTVLAFAVLTIVVRAGQRL